MILPSPGHELDQARRVVADMVGPLRKGELSAADYQIYLEALWIVKQSEPPPPRSADRAASK